MLQVESFQNKKSYATPSHHILFKKRICILIAEEGKSSTRTFVEYLGLVSSVDFFHASCALFIICKHKVHLPYVVLKTKANSSVKELL